MSTFEVIYRGARLGPKGVLVYRYDRAGIAPDATAEEGTSLWFKKRFKRPWHRIGDVLQITEKGKGQYTTVSKEPLRHEDAPQDCAEDHAARQSSQAERVAKKLARRDDLLDSIEPLRQAYRRMTAPERSAMVTWVVRQMMSWS